MLIVQVFGCGGLRVGYLRANILCGGVEVDCELGGGC